MKCCSQDELQAYLLDTLVDETQTQIEQHVAACVSCRQTLQTLADDDLVRDYFEANLREGSQSHTSSVDDSEENPHFRWQPENWQSLSEDEQLEVQFGRFQLQEFLGSGGFGVVYRARDLDLQREVAVKIPHLGGLSPNVRPRFLREGAAAASLHHPHIVQVHQAGEHGGVCFLVSEYCPGRTLRHFMSERPGGCSAADAVDILLPLARAVQHAHENGVVHRDIKPANVILDDRNARPGLPFCPKLTDFGTARMEGANDAVTASGMLVGTARYMAPEQVVGAADVGPSADIYALGVVLYELLAGQAPIQGADNAETLHRVLSNEPTPLHRIVSGVPRDMSAICSRCLEKKPQQRYGSAAALADDLVRFLNHEPTFARPLGPARRVLRWSRRNPLPLSISLTIVTLLAVIVVGFAWNNRRLRDVNSQLSSVNRQARTSADRAKDSEQHAHDLLYASDMQRAEKAWREGDIKGALDLLKRHLPEPNQPDRRGIEWYFLQRAARPPAGVIADYAAPLYCVRISPDHQAFAVAGQDAKIRLHDRLSGDVIAVIPSGQKEVNCVDFSPSGGLLASAGDDGSVKIWRLSDGKQVLRIAAHKGLAFGVAFTTDGKRLITCGTDAEVHVWNAASGQRLTTYRDHRDEVEAIAVAPNGRLLASVGQDGVLVVRDLTTGEVRFKWDDALGDLSAVVFSPDSTKIAVSEAAGESKSLKVFDLATKTTVLSRQQHDGIQSIAYSPNGDEVLTLDKAGTARIWDVASKESGPGVAPTELWQAHNGRGYSATFEPDGRSLLTVGKEGQVRRWNPRQLDNGRVLAGSGHLPIHDIAFLPDNTGVVAAAHLGVAILKCDSKAAPEPVVQGSLTWSCAAAPSGADWFTAASTTDWRATAQGRHLPARIKRWDGVERRSRTLLETAANCSVNDLSCSPRGDYLAVVLHHHPISTGSKELLLLNAKSGSLMHKIPAAAGTKARFTPDGRWLAYGVQRDLHLIELDSQDRRVIVKAHADSQDGLAISADGRWIATCDSGRLIKLWDFATLNLQAVLRGHRGLITAMEFSPDSRTLLSSSSDGTVKAWSAVSGQSLMNLHLGATGVSDMALAADGRHLAIVEDAKSVRIYDLR